MRYWLVFIIMFLTACGSNDEEAIDYEADLQAYGTEAANIRSDMVVGSTAIVSTVSAAEAQSNAFNSYNTILRQTAVAVMPPTTEARIIANDVDGPLPPEVYDLSDGIMRVVQIGPAGQIDESGCFIEKQQFFRTGDSAIYMTAVALNLRAGTSIRADWQFGSDLVFSNSMVAPQSEQYRCIALALRPSDAEFSAGNWSVTLSVDGEPTEPRSFTILNN